MIDKDLKTIAEHFGIDNQETKLIEEIGELLQAISKFTINDTEKNAKHVIEEMVDLKIVLEQLEYFLDNDSFIEKMRKEKIQRTLERIKSGYYNK